MAKFSIASNSTVALRGGKMQVDSTEREILQPNSNDLADIPEGQLYFEAVNESAFGFPEQQRIETFDELVPPLIPFTDDRLNPKEVIPIALPPGVELKPKTTVKYHSRNESAFEQSSHKRMSRSYEEVEINALVRADAEGGRKAYLLVTRALQIPVNTADHIVARARRNPGKVHDHGHDIDSHVDHNSKHDHWADELMIQWLHMNAGLSLPQLLHYLNNEKLRRLLKEEGVEVSDNDVTSLDAKSYLDAYPSIKEKFDAVRIKSTTTIERWLQDMAYTRKHVVAEKTTVNSESSMAARLQYAKAIKQGLLDPSNFWVFFDEVPFYMTMYRTYGYAPKGQRAVVKIPPTSTMSFRTQVPMAVNPQIGYVFGDSFPPERKTSIRKNGTQGKEVFLPTWGKQQFSYFMDSLLDTLFSLQLRLQGHKIVLVIDGAPEHPAKKNTDEFLRTLKNYKKLSDYLSQHNGELRILRAAPNSPQLNLCEYYNRTLRSYANEKRHERDVDPNLLNDFKRGSKISSRIDVLKDIIQESLAKSQSSHPQTNSVRTMMTFVDKVIAAKGYLDMHEPM